MSSPSEGASSAPNPPAEPASEASPAAASAEEPRREGPPIRIGTQRSGVKPPPAVAKPVLPSPPPELLAKARRASAPAENQGAEEPAAAAPPAPAETRAPVKDQPQPPPKKKPPLVPVAEPQPPRKYPPPNIRGQLSEDLQLEYLAALGEVPLDDIIAGEEKEVAAELELESRHKGTVVSLHREDVFVEIGGRWQGVVPLKNFTQPPEPGSVIDVVVSRFDPAEGLYELTLPGAAVEVGDWSEVAEGMVVEARVTGHNKGGLECEVNRLRGFIPASQIAMYRVDDLAQFVDQKFPCVVTEANPEKRNLVLSRRAMLEREAAEAREQIMASLEIGQTREGTVRSLQNFGAFFDLGGVDGLIHISQLSWDRIKHADEVLELGQKVKVKILKIDPQTGKIGLGFRDLSENPWENAARDYPVRTPVKGRVTRITEFGAFVRLGPGVEGLVHISELSHKRVFRVTDVLTEGQEVDVMVLSVDPEQQRISLSMKALEAKPQAAAKEEQPETPEPAAPPPAPKKRTTPLKGGIGGPPTGEKFGLKW
jgi:small subunit ribosomal protein S1